MLRPVWASALASAFACACSMHTMPAPAPPAITVASAARPHLSFVVPSVAPAPSAAAPISLTDGEGKRLELITCSERTRVEGPLAETELHLTFHNSEARIREGRFRLVLPRGAFVSRLAMEIDGAFREADVGELSHARAFYESAMHVRRDPLLVEQRGDEELTARVFPIPANGDKQIIVRWIATMPGSGALAVRSGDLLVARVVVPPAEGEGALAAIDRGLVLLVDTSASRGPDFEKQLTLVEELLATLARRGPQAAVTVAAFDQGVTVVHRGAVGAFGPAELAALRSHGALGASDLEGALVWAAGEVHATPATRLVIVGDARATAGSADLTRLRGAARALGAAGVERLDVVALGEARSESTMRALAVGPLGHDGMVIEGTRPATEIAARLTMPARSGVQVSLPGARWIWPSSFDGVQTGDKRFVYAELQASAPTAVHVDGHTTTLAPVAGTSALLGRAVAKAKIDALVARGEARGYDVELRARIVKLSIEKRVPSPFTAFLVTESERDRQWFLRPPPTVAPAAAAQPARTAAPAPSTAGRGRQAAGHVVVRPPLIRIAECTFSGRLGPEILQQTVRQQFGRFRACYELGLLRRGALEGRVSTKFRIDSDGAVRVAEDAGSDLPDRQVVSCVVQAFKELQFPAAPGGVITVTYPLVFTPTESDALEATRARTRANERSLMPFVDSPAPPPLAPSAPPPPPPPPPQPWTGVYADTRAALERGDLARALELASAARSRDGDDVSALIALGEALEAASLPALAARAYGSIADLHPHDAESLRVAAGRLDVMGKGCMPLAIELWRRAKDDRPDQPAGHHALAMALLRVGAYEQASDTLSAALAITFDERYWHAREVLETDLAFVATALGRRLGAQAPLTNPSLRFVLSWETDASNLALSLRDAAGDPQSIAFEAAASDGYGPEASSVLGARGERTATRVAVRFLRRGPTGTPMGIVHVMEHDGRGHVSVRPMPFVIMNEGAAVDLGTFE